MKLSASAAIFAATFTLGLLSASSLFAAAPSIVNVAAVEIGQESATVTWQTDVPSTSHVLLVTSKELTSAEYVVQDLTPVTFHTIRLTNLRPAATYAFYVASQTSAGELSNSKQTPTEFQTLPPNESAPIDFHLKLYGPRTVYAGSDLYLTLTSAQLGGPLTHLYLIGPAGLPSSISYTPICRLHTSDCLFDTQSQLPFNWNASNSRTAAYLRLRTQAATVPGEYTFQMSARVGDVVRTTDYTIRVLPPPAAVTAAPAVNAPPIPGIVKWEKTMKDVAAKWCKAGEVMSFGNESQVWYYDGGRVYQQIADYTNDTSWLICADNILFQYRDNVIQRDGQIQGWRSFSHGMAMKYWRTGDPASKDAVLRLAANSAFAPSGGSPDPDFIRETSYLIETYIKAEQLDGVRRPLLARAVDFLLGDLDILLSGPSEAAHQLFFDGLGSEALIQYYELTGDPRIPPAIKRLLDWEWANGWDASRNKLIYNPAEMPLNYTTVSNNLVAPAFAWYWSITHDDLYRERGDTLFLHSLDEDIAYSGKVFCQNFRSSIDYVTWRSGARWSASNPAANIPAAVQSTRSLAPEIKTADSTITWTTPVPTSGQVEFGSSESLDDATAIDITPATIHSVSLSTIPGRSYYFRTRSVDANGKVSRSDVMRMLSGPVQYEASTDKSYWLDANWPLRVPVTIDGTKVAAQGGALTDFPVLVRVSLAALASVNSGGLAVTNDGKEFVFADATGNRLDSEIDSYNPQTGTLAAWVRIPALTATDTQLYLYFGNANPVTPAQSVWKAGYNGVWHMTFSPDMAAVKDSTGSGNDAQSMGSSPADGKIGSGNNSGASQYLQLNSPSLNAIGSTFTIQAWVKLQFGTPGRIFSAYDFNKKLGYELSTGENGSRIALTVGNGVQQTVVASTDPVVIREWYAMTAVYDNGSVRLYLNGQPVAMTSSTSTVSAVVPTTLLPAIGRSPVREIYQIYGVMDEVRISTVPKTADWIATEYQNQNAPDTFVRVGSLQSL